MPHICVVDKFGAINYNGEAKAIDLVAKVEELLLATEATKAEPTKSDNLIEAERDYKVAKALVHDSNTDAAV